MKKESKKKYLKNNIISFVIGTIIFGVIGIYAVVTFPSNEVFYDNTSSGLSSTNIKGVIDELYGICTTPSTAGDTILDNVDIVTSGDGLYKDSYEDGRYFYKGKNPNNYVTFNNEAAGWRIISVEADGTIKIMRNTSIGNRVWDSSGGAYGNNNWARPASLNTYLNSTYYNGLNTTAQGQVVAKDFSIGAVTYNDTNLSNTISNENSKKWNGKVALATTSEYIRSNSNQSSCGTMNQVYSSTSCGNTTWMNNSTYWWTLSPYSGYSYGVFYVGSGIGLKYAGTSRGVRPVVYLSAEVQITGGDGSQNNPYTLG